MIRCENKHPAFCRLSHPVSPHSLWCKDGGVAFEIPNNLAYFYAMNVNRGITTLFPDEMIVVPVKRNGTGRDPRLHELRNECLLHRYLFLYNRTRWEYPMLIRALGVEFFISIDTVKEVIADNADLVKQFRRSLNEKGFTKDLFESKYPHMNWETPLLEYYA